MEPTELRNSVGFFFESGKSCCTEAHVGAIFVVNYFAAVLYKDTLAKENIDFY